MVTNGDMQMSKFLKKLKKSTEVKFLKKMVKKIISNSKIGNKYEYEK